MVSPSMVIAEGLFLGHDLLAWLVLAIGGAMLVGNVAAMVRPPEGRGGAPLPPAPRGRSFTYIAIGAVATIWALATLLSN